jgi:hypothetical protein
LSSSLFPVFGLVSPIGGFPGVLLAAMVVNGGGGPSPLGEGGWCQLLWCDLLGFGEFGLHFRDAFDDG